MAVPFKNIPGGLRVPLFYAELDPSKANTAPIAQRALLIGQRTSASGLMSNVPVQIISASDAIAAAGPNSILADMITAYRANDPDGEVWMLPLGDDPGGTKAAGSITVTGTTTASGTLALYLGGKLVSIALAGSTAEAAVATAIVQAISARTDLVLTAAIDGANPAKVNLSAANAGICGNNITVRQNYLGSAGGEATPAGLSLALVDLAGGTVNPTLTDGLANLQDLAFDFIASALTDSASTAAIANLLNDVSGRWSWSSQVYGHCFIAVGGTVGSLSTFGTTLNNQHITAIGYSDSPSPAWSWAAAFTGAGARSLRADPGVPLQYLTVAGLLAPPIQSRFSLLLRNALLYAGISTWTVDATGAVVMENIITTYVTNAQGVADNSYLEVETMFLLMYVMRNLASVVTAKYSRVKLAADGTRLRAGSNVVTPSIIRADIIAAYQEMEADGMVQGSTTFAAGLTVEQNTQNPNRVDVLYPAILINQLRVFAALVQFRLSAS